MLTIHSIEETGPAPDDGIAAEWARHLAERAAHRRYMGSSGSARKTVNMLRYRMRQALRDERGLLRWMGLA